MRFEDMTPYTLVTLNELELESAERIIGYKREQGMQWERDRAVWLDECIDIVVSEFGSYELDFLRAMDDCPFTQSHTRHWCGRQFCRDA